LCILPESWRGRWSANARVNAQDCSVLRAEEGVDTAADQRLDGVGAAVEADLLGLEAVDEPPESMASAARPTVPQTRPPDRRLPAASGVMAGA
jgi:hypothetical protein